MNYEKSAFVELGDFLDVITNIEKYFDGARIFWEAKDALGNFLSQPLKPEKVEKYAGSFLKKWRSYRHIISWTTLANDWKDDKQQIAMSLANTKLEDADESALSKCAKLFDHLSKVSGIGPTNASKLLALSLTDICVMWDKGICNDFRMKSPPRLGFSRRAPSNASDWYFRFLICQQRRAKSLIEQCMKQNRFDRNEAVEWLRGIALRIPSRCPREKPLAWLLDQYEYGKTRICK